MGQIYIKHHGPTKSKLHPPYLRLKLNYKPKTKDPYITIKDYNALRSDPNYALGRRALRAPGTTD